ncbi:hypothetical protein [Bacillus sp. KH172YL63]|uniref:hypothetical protein n=1 Tax=Bacillus sp. KH172YL63 TaxID=2709784 RepID=UPI0013E522F7|nr:hypothetical protein [Bacillus sp. KH172YL63]BCB04307.1 hypothetical protein KH172YL63_24400 [Bacillus sp. KH172YL63]
MSLPFFLTIFILMVYVVIFMDKKLYFVCNSILFMILSILSTNYFTIMTNTLEWMKASMDVTQFISLLINRECILPLAGVVMANGALCVKTRIGRFSVFASVWLFISGLDALHLHFHSLVYPDWSLMNTVVINAMYLIICVGLGRGLYYLQSREERRRGQSI